MAEYYDTHAHLDYSEFADDLAEVIQRAKDSQITRIISIGTDFESSRRAIALSEQFPEVYAVVGWHPSDAMSAPDDVRSPMATTLGCCASSRNDERTSSGALIASLGCQPMTA